MLALSLGLSAQAASGRPKPLSLIVPATVIAPATVIQGA